MAYLHCYANTTDDETNDPRFGVMGKQKCKIQALSRKRMETVDDEFIAASVDFMKRSKKSRQAVFCVAKSKSYAHVYPFTS